MICAKKAPCKKRRALSLRRRAPAENRRAPGGEPAETTAGKRGWPCRGRWRGEETLAPGRWLCGEGRPAPGRWPRGEGRPAPGEMSTRRGDGRAGEMAAPERGACTGEMSAPGSQAAPGGGGRAGPACSSAPCFAGHIGEHGPSGIDPAAAPSCAARPARASGRWGGRLSAFGGRGWGGAVCAEFLFLKYKIF